jgi:hypothetical protein
MQAPTAAESDVLSDDAIVSRVKTRSNTVVVPLIVLIKTWLLDSGECPRLTAVPVDGRPHSSRHDRAHHMRHFRMFCLQLGASEES